MDDMQIRKRIYDIIIEEHLKTQRQMVFVSGPRQVGKTTACLNHTNNYANWDNTDDREVILGGPDRIIERFKLNRLSEVHPVVLFDELHKYPRWKQFLKGFFDAFSDQIRIIVTGSSRMDVYRRGGDSLMGRYFLYRMHPFSVAELIHQDIPDQNRIIRNPGKISEQDFNALWTYGGYPEPFLKRDLRFSRRWQSLRTEQLLREDVRSLTQIQQIDQLEILIKLLAIRSSRQLVYANLAKDVRVSVDTIRRWINVMSSLHFGFLVKPWFKNISRSLRKEPKWYMRDWSEIADAGDRAETFVGCHLLKAVEGWTDLGFGNFQLSYLRDKEQRETDFVVIKDGKPWFLAEVKQHDGAVSKALRYYQEQTKAPFAFQIVIDANYVDADCFAGQQGPIAVPARTFLSQLL